MADNWGLGRVVWAKTNMSDTNAIEWSSLAQHSIDTAMVALKVWGEMLPESVTRRIVDGFNGNEDTAKRTISFLAGCHDVGKSTPVFEQQAYGLIGDKLLNSLEGHGLHIPSGIGRPSSLRHEISSYWALLEWMESQGVPKMIAERLAITVGGHHGVFYGVTKDIWANDVYGEQNKEANAMAYGDGQWSNARKSIINAIAEQTIDSSIIESWSNTPIDLDVQTLISGIITVSDWVASDSGYGRFVLTSNGLVSSSDEMKRVNHAWDDLNLPYPHEWKANPIDDFPERFGLPDGAEPNHLQSAVLSASETIRGLGGMMIIEAPMGGGKTEAALIASESLGRKNGSGGIAFTLPTQATADGILPRFASWAVKSTDDVESVNLLHGRAWLNSDWQGIRNGSMYDNGTGSGLVSNHWFDGSKQGLLANFVVCTIDQVLMMSLQAKHFDLRHLGLAGKVIIIDEVHAADDYMMVYLNRSLEWLGSYKAPVIVLSATLPRERRESMVMAYRRGLAGDSASAREQELKVINGSDEYHDAYPLITVADDSHAKLIPIREDDGQHPVTVSITHGDIEDLKHLMGRGGNALVIRDTVSRAQDTYRSIMEDPYFDDWDAELLHARFVSTDRRRKEEEIRNKYGRKATIENGMRPTKSIVIATQVVEQSLDVDFDVLLTDVCPMDLLLQRIGRTHRHSSHDDGRPLPLRNVNVIIDGWEMTNGKVHLNKECTYVYHPAKLLRTIALTGFNDGTVIELPNQISPLVQDAYNVPMSDDAYDAHSLDALIPMSRFHECPMSEEFMRQLKEADSAWLDEIRYEEHRANAFLLRSPHRMRATDRSSKRKLLPYDILKGANDRNDGDSDEEMRAQVRDSDMGINCILMVRDGDHVRFVDSLDCGDNALDDRHGLVSLDTGVMDYGLVRDIASQTITLPPQLSKGRLDSMIAWMETHCRVPAWQGQRALKGEFILMLDDNGDCVVELPSRHNGKDAFLLHYDSEIGLTCEKEKQN